MERFGPTYCETPETIAGIFPVEPANAISSGVIVLFGLLALFQVMRRSPRSIELYVLCALLITNGVGSILWHGLRTRWSLTLDFLPAAIFVLVMAIVWARRVAPWQQVALAFAAFLGTLIALRFVDLGLPIPGRMAASAIAIVGLAVWLIARSAAVSREAAMLGGAALVSALTALTFRSIDPWACATFGTGSHFLWHVFLSAGAYLSLLTIMKLREAPPQTRPLAAET
jgi:Ceramidase